MREIPVLKAMPNECQIATLSTHIIPLPQCCPVSRNPQPGSLITVMYRPVPTVLEVYSLTAYVNLYGTRNAPYGIRNMETMIQQIAQDCADLLGVYTLVGAILRLQLDHIMPILIEARPS